ncbi:MAG: ABC transporter ATP-binding protein [bacterium]|nr:ABC transporter ATP-binding protein [bacterium]
MLKRLAKCVRQYKRESILAPIFMIGEVLMESIITLFMARLINYGIYGNNGNIGAIAKYGLLLMLFCAVSLISGALSGKFAAIASAGFAKNVRNDMYDNIQNFSFSNIDKFSTSGIITRMTTDVTNVQNAYQMIIRVAVRSPIMLVFSLIMSFYFSPRLAIIFLCSIPVLGVGLFFIIRYAHPLFKRVFKIYDNLNNVVQENLHGIRVVKSFVREDFEVKKFKNVSNEIYSYSVRAEKLIALNAPLMSFCIYSSILLVSWLGAKMIIGSNGLSIGELTSLITYAVQILMSMMMISTVFVMIIMARASAQRIVEVLDEQSTITNCDNPVFEVKSGDITFKNVSFSYSNDPDNCCLMDVDLNIKSGETVGIIGSTGSSKSSLVQLIPRLYDTTKGEVLVGGINVKDYDIESLRNQVAMVLQKNVLFSGTINENVRWGDQNATDEEVIRVCKLAQADEFINKFPNKYNTYIEQGGKNVSGGQKQRLCIARALLKKPKILILDDSTSAVDTATDALIQKSFSNEIPNTTKIIIAQRISSVENADRIIVMDGGRVSGFDTHENLLASNTIYREVYESQVKGGAL